MSNDDVLTYRLAKWTLPFTFAGPVFGACHMQKDGIIAVAVFSTFSQILITLFFIKPTVVSWKLWKRFENVEKYDTEEKDILDDCVDDLTKIGLDYVDDS